MSAETTGPGRRRGLAGWIDGARAARPLVKTSQWALTGGYVRRLNEQLSADLRAGPHESVLELGCGDAPLLGHLSPKRYVGLDFNAASLAAARRRFGARDGTEFVEADLVSDSLVPWRGVDAVVCSAVFHHLSDEQLLRLSTRILEEVGPRRVVCTDGVMTGPFRRALVWLDEGDPSRPKERLYSLLGRDWQVEESWSFDVPLRTVHEFGFELRPLTPTRR
jgi:SAM-dependent methyltransferase